MEDQRHDGDTPRSLGMENCSFLAGQTRTRVSTISGSARWRARTTRVRSQSRRRGSYFVQKTVELTNRYHVQGLGRLCASSMTSRTYSAGVAFRLRLTTCGNRLERDRRYPLAASHNDWLSHTSRRPFYVTIGNDSSFKAAEGCNQTQHSGKKSTRGLAALQGLFLRIRVLRARPFEDEWLPTIPETAEEEEEEEEEEKKELLLRYKQNRRRNVREHRTGHVMMLAPQGIVSSVDWATMPDFSPTSNSQTF